MSFGESLSRVALTAALGPAGEATALSLMAAEVMSDTSLQLTQMGYDAKTAGTMAAIAAGAEVVSESVSLEMLFKTFPSAAGVKGFLTKTLTQMFTEGGEEVTSDLINNTADVLMEMFTDNSSQKTKEIESYIKNEGLNFDEAYRKWTTAHLKEYVIDFAAGTVSGGLMGGGYNALSQGLDLAENTAGLLTENRQARAQLEQNLEKASPEALREALKNSRALRPQLQSLMEKGLAHPDSKVRQQARALQLSAEKTGRVSAVKAGRLINTMNTANTNLSKGVAAARLEQAGADKAVISAVHAAVEGQELTAGQLKAIKSNREALNTISELYAQATKSENNPFGEKIYLTSQSDEKLIRQMVSRLPGTALKESGSATAPLSAQAAVFRGAGELGKNGVRSLEESYNPDLGLNKDMHTAAFMLAYNLANSGKKESEILSEVQSALPAGDPASERFREAAILESIFAAKKDMQAQVEESRQAERSENPVEEESLQTGGKSGIINRSTTAKSNRFRSFDLLSDEQRAAIRTETGWSDEIITAMRTLQEYKIYLDANLVEKRINNRACLVKKQVNLEHADEKRRKNRFRAKIGLAIVDDDGKSLELHHIGQRIESPLAELTFQEHRSKGNDAVLHDKKKKTNVHNGTNNWNRERRNHWKNRFKDKEER